MASSFLEFLESNGSSLTPEEAGKAIADQLSAKLARQVAASSTEDMERARADLSGFMQRIGEALWWHCAENRWVQTEIRKLLVEVAKRKSQSVPRQGGSA